jgi:diguanylate cyclase (GGDEF)-like protein
LFSIRFLLRACVGLSLLGGFAVHAACLASAQGELAPLEALAFRAPAQAQAQLAQWAARPTLQASKQRAELAAIAADVYRQLSKDDIAAQHSAAGLAALAPDTQSDLALRLQAAHAASGEDAKAAVLALSAAIASADKNPLAQGCLLRDRGWRYVDSGNLEGALSDLMQAHALLTQHSNRDEQAVAMGRLAIVYVDAGDHTAALALIDETIDHFRNINAPVRLATALARRATSLIKLKRLPEAEAAAQEAVAVSLAHGDKGGAGFALFRQCQIAGLQDREADALALCDRAEVALREGGALDAGTQDGLALTRIEVLRSRPPNAAELALLQKAVAEAEQAGSAALPRLRLERAKALAAQGQHKAAYADLQEVLRLQRRATESERINAQAALRVRFETDRALARSAALAEQNQSNKERFWWAAAGAGGLLAAVAGLGYTLVLSRRHRARLTEVAERDELTRLPNRRKILQLAELEFAQARRRRSSLVVGVLDIDHFKRINDQHGHDGGDRVLRSFGSAATGALRGTDSLGRWGGEEFLVLLPDCPLPAALEVAERLRHHLGTHAVPVDAGEPLRFSVSIGLARAGPDDANLQVVLQRADAALYAAKAQGRNRVVLDGAATPCPPACDCETAPAN